MTWRAVNKVEYKLKGKRTRNTSYLGLNEMVQILLIYDHHTQYTCSFLDACERKS